MTLHWPLDPPPLPVQAAALEKAKLREGFAYFMDPGTGKTGLILAEFSLAEVSEKADLLVVLCPNNLRANWEAEARKMGFAYEVSIFPDPVPKVGMWIINYEKLVSSSAFDAIWAVIKKRRFMMVADESHRIKNFKAKSTKAAIFLFGFAKIRRVMTGTPLANSVVDLWSQLRCINEHGNHRTAYTFRNRYGIMGGWMGKQVVGTQREEELAEHLDECSFKAKKKDWMATLPPKAYYVLNYDMNGQQKRLYNQMMKDRILDLANVEVSAPMVITALMKMQQITSGFTIDNEGNVVSLCHGHNNPKIEAVKEAREEMTGKVIMFAHYRETVNMLDAAFPGSLVIRGGMDKDDVREIVDLFNNDDSRLNLIAQVETAKEGLTLLGTENQPCCTTIFVENNYSLITRTQAEDRNHRHGQKGEQVSYYDMVGSRIESKIIDALQRKTDLVRSIMERDHG